MMYTGRIEFMNHALPRALFGYSRPHVDSLLQDLSASLARLSEEKLDLAKRAGRLEEALAEYRQREIALREALIATRRTSEDIKAAAQKEAQLVLDTANSRAESLLNNANLRLARVMEEAAEAQKAKARFELKLRSVIEGHLRLMELDRQESASLDAAVAKLAKQGPEA